MKSINSKGKKKLLEPHIKLINVTKLNTSRVYTIGNINLHNCRN